MVRGWGGYVMMDLTMIREDERPRERRGWVITPLLEDTGVAGSCVKFYYAMDGVNVESLRLMRVDIDTSGDINKISGGNKTRTEGETAEVYSRGIEASFGFNVGEIEVKDTLCENIGRTINIDTLTRLQLKMLEICSILHSRCLFLLCPVLEVLATFTHVTITRDFLLLISL